MRKFYLNRQFFDFYLGCYYPIKDSYYLYVISRSFYFKKHMKYASYHCQICICPPSLPIKDKIFNAFFEFDVLCCNRKVQMINLEYLFGSNFSVAHAKSFPLTPCWFLPCTRYDLWLNRVAIALDTFSNHGLL